MIVWLVAHGNFLLLDPPHQLALYMIPCRMGRWWSLLEDPAHVVEKTGGGQHDRGRLQIVPAVQKELSVTVALGG